MRLNIILSAVLALVVIILFPIGIWAVAASDTFLSADTYKNGLASQNLYDDFAPVALPAIARAAEADGASSQMIVIINNIRDRIGEEAWREIANKLIPPDWLQIQVEGVIDTVFDTMGGAEIPDIGAVIDFQGLRNRLTGATGDEVINQIIESAQDCTASEINRLESYTSHDTSSLPICHPPENLTSTLQGALQSEFVRLSDEIARLQDNPATFMTRNGGDDQVLRLLTETYQQLLSLAYLCPLGILALIVTFAVRSFQGFGRWIGITLIIVGILALLPLPFIRVSIADGIAELISSSAETLETRVFQTNLAAGLLLSAFNEFSQPVLLQGFGFIVLGGFLLSMIAWQKRRKITPLMMTADGQLYSPTTGRFVGTVTSSSMHRPPDQ